MTTPQPTEYGTAKTMIVQPGNGTRYLIVYGENFVALPDFGKAATMSPHPVEWGYVADKLDLNQPDAQAVCLALQQVHDAEPTADPYRVFCMFTPEGNKAVAEMLDEVFRVAEEKMLLRGAIRALLQQGVFSVYNSGHKEVGDTEPRAQITRDVNEWLTDHGFAQYADGSLL